MTLAPIVDSATGGDDVRGSAVAAKDSLAGLVDLVARPSVQAALEAVREMLGMDVAYMSQIVGDEMVLRELGGDGKSFRMARGLTLPLEQTYCQRMLDGRVPNMIGDVRGEDRLASLPLTQIADIGAFATVPLMLADGSTYGTLCAASHDARSLGYQELQFLKVFARLIVDQLERELAAVAFGELAALVNAADDAILGITPTGVVTSWNPSCERMFGYPAETAIGQNVVALIAPPGQEEGMRKIISAVAAGEVSNHQSRRQRADGRLVDAAVTLSPIRDEQGSVNFISAVIRDISIEVRDARYRTIEIQVISALEGAKDAREAADGTLRAMSQGLECDLAAMWEIDDDAQRLRCTATWVNLDGQAAALAESMSEHSFGRGEGLPGRVWTDGKSVWFDRLDDADEFTRAAAAVAAGLRTAVALPLRANGEIIGVVEFFASVLTTRSDALLAMGEAVVTRLADALVRHQAPRSAA